MSEFPDKLKQAELERESPLSEAPPVRRNGSRGSWLVLVTALVAALGAAVATGISIGKVGARNAPKLATRAVSRPLLGPPHGLKLDRDLKAFAKRAAEMKDKQRE